ncbi:Hypothetical predicted protein [Xyrichtys novacula]|uniref:Uncharacterized protein n=1 Tax=Xyrichtys novacula TaxID=13765 RepID=A0AAV1FNC1_XYRNO|nr:Hypothetical predicted protein [Xyrichtys novacula]
MAHREKPQEGSSSWRLPNKHREGSKERTEEYEECEGVRKLGEVGRQVQQSRHEYRRKGVQECDLVRSLLQSGNRTVKPGQDVQK